jgi:hypothetical protein
MASAPDRIPAATRTRKPIMTDTLDAAPEAPAGEDGA